MPIVITPGEPAGIGPDLVIQLAQHTLNHEWICIADPHMLRLRAAKLGLPLTIIPYPGRQKTPQTAGSITVLQQDLANPECCGNPDPANAKSLLAALQRAVTGCQKNEFSALVTGPLHKASINDAGIRFTGHTEYLAELTKTKKVVMMLATFGAEKPLRVALATTHLPLSEVSTAITQDTLRDTLRILHHDLKHHFNLTTPNILICGLNPHAGEDGHLGHEEIDIMIPVIKECQQQGMQLKGPLPADTLFTPRYLKSADAVLAMYHDQGLPVLKHVGFGNAVNITLGLPIIRTSVDHGTAFELAGSGKAEMGSLHAALNMAIEITSKK